MKNKILPPPPGFHANCLTPSSRKRKLTVDQPGIISEYDVSRESNLQYEINSVSRNSLPQSVDSGTLRNRSGKEQCHSLNNFTPTVQINDWDFDKAEVEKISISSLGMQPQSFHHAGSLLLNEMLAGDNFIENDQINGGGNVLIRKETRLADIKKSGRSVVEMVSPRNSDNSANVVVEDGRRNDVSDASLGSSDVRSKSHVGKFGPIVAEKLWDGSLQLNSSVTVSAVAFFKSGEKMPDLKWPEFVEVKGKVRLEAFEKYIQDLPRSRSRGLMVISLCWNEGSSKSGLAGLKEVAKGYKKGERVGFAQPAKGIDLYICPRSNTIITILAKHGFFKGMAAVEENQNSLIGCVVWRRNQMSSKLVIKKSERKSHSLSKQPLNFPSDSSNQTAKEKGTQPAQESLQVASGTDCKNLDIAARNNNVECKNTETSQVHPELHISYNPELHASSTNPSLLLTSSVLSNSPSVSKGLQISSISTSGSVTMGQSLQVEAPPSSSQDIPNPTLEIDKHVISLSSDSMRKPLLATDDDDLPEFDFGTACGISQTPTSKLLSAARVEKKLPAEEFTKLNGSLPSMMPASNQRAFGDFSVLWLPPDALQGMPLQKKICEDSKIPALPNSERKHATQNMIPFSTAAVPLPKDTFYDDDDMPEWCPPNTTMPSTTPIFSGPQSHMLPSPSPAVCPPFFTQAFTHGFHCSTSYNVRPSRSRFSKEYILQAPNSLTGFSPNPVLRPPLKPFDVKLPVHHAGWRGWKP